MSISATLPEVQTSSASLNDIGIIKSIHNGKEVMDRINFKGDELEISDRFLNSMCSLLRISKSVFSLFEPNEVLSRAKDRLKLDKVRLTSVDGRALALTKFGKPIVDINAHGKILDNFGCQKAEYVDGVVRSYHTPSIPSGSEIFGDKFAHQFVIDTPVDGYGLPAAFASILRLVCSNGLVGYSPAFKSEINLGRGENPMAIMERFIESYNNEEAYDAMRRRVEASRTSPASVYEVNKLQKILSAQGMRSLHNDVNFRQSIDGSMHILSDITRKLDQMAGDPLDKYGVVSFNALDDKRMRMLPVDCTVYDIINLATEVSSHRADEIQSRKINAHIGDLITKQYDLEGTISSDDVCDFVPDFYLGINNGN